ncbi:FAD-dependent oxidoreductase [Rhizobium sp. L1K21]|uniref:FAD-dependent oxidoreductase n=1 Tax=Rhizobium sp. L1K21 TaxID=2954933 RepID=UPI00209242B7|nr:FAD-dependent oxidoreductase [Rhizobium sp. L1K21]MCO6184750.1 FAD-dependent oxidoreductase [Rhizobium sp. L1K21]
MKRIILAGGGHAHLIVLEHLAREALGAVEVVLVSPSRWQYYSGMLPGWIAGHYLKEDCRIDLLPLAARAGVQFVEQRLIAIAADASQITLADGSTLDYDFLSLDIGAEAHTPWAQGLEDRLTPAKPLDQFQVAWEAMLESARQTGALNLVTVGGGAAGVELSLVCKTALDTAGVETGMSLVMGQNGLLHEHAPAVRRRARRALENMCIRLIEGRAHADGGQLCLASGARLSPDRIIAATGATAPAWLAQSGLALDENGFVMTDAHLRSISHANVFAAGDISSRTDVSLPRSGVHAVKAGPVLAGNLAAVCRAGSLKRYKPRKSSLYIMASGKERAIASWGIWSAEGRLIWWWKDFIDRRFMRRFQNVGD